MAVEFTVGRHAADDEAGVHPLVAAALEAREAPAPGVHRLDPPAATGPATEGDGGLGWPGTPGDGTGLGWPGDTDAHATPAAPAPGPRRSVWRRLFGLAEPARGRSAA